jgi:hypothetical protein
MYPTFNDPIIPLGKATSATDVGSTVAISSASVESVLDISAHAAITELPTMRAKEASVRPVTDPPNHRTSPYAIRMIVRFLKILLVSEFYIKREYIDIRVYWDREELLLISTDMKGQKEDPRETLTRYR